jgi:phage gpG-like protein
MPFFQYTIEVPTDLPEALPAIMAAVGEKLTLSVLQLQRHIVTEKLSGQMLKARSGRLIESVQPIPTVVGETVATAGVRAGGGQAFYGAIQEFGGTRGYPIVPVTKKALSFEWLGSHWIRQRVYRKPLPPRPFMASSLQEMIPTIVENIEAGIAEALGAV